MVWPAVIGAVGALGSGLLSSGLLKKKKKINPILQAVNWGKAAGIHPLAAIGANMSPWGGTVQDNLLGDAIGMGLSGASNAVSDYMQQDQDRMDAEKAASESRSRDALDRAERNAVERRLALEREKDRIRQDRFDQAQMRLMDAQAKSLEAEARAQAIGGTQGGNVSLNTDNIGSGISHRLQMYRDGNGHLRIVGGGSPSQHVKNIMGETIGELHGANKFEKGGLENALLGDLKRRRHNRTVWLMKMLKEVSEGAKTNMPTLFQ